VAKMSTEKRNSLKDSQFGIPDKRKFPLNDAAHIEDAAKKVGYAKGADRKPLARKILRRAREYNLDTSGWKKVKLFAQEQVPPMSDGTSIGNAPPHTLAPYYEEDELMKRVKGVSNQTDPLALAKSIANRIHAKYVADQKPPTGNQNCELCTWCAEANFRGINVLPRPIYSPRDPAFDVYGESIVMNPDRKEFPNFQELNDWIMTQPNARFYVHVKWNGGTGGHEFMLISFNIPSILDPQQGIFEPMSSLKIFNDYFGNIDYSESYICRLDDRPLNKALLTKMNSMTMLVPWDESKDIPYMREHGMLCDEDEQYAKDHGMIASDDPVQESAKDNYASDKPIPIQNYKPDIVYFGCAKKLNDKIDIDKQLFITPYKGIASIFSADRPWVRQLYRMGIRSFNSDYDEWNQTDGLDEPLKVVHVRVHDYDGKSFEPFELTGNGFIYAIDISKLKDHVAKYEWMDQSKEALLVDLNEVPIKDVQPVTVRYIIRPDVENFQESSTDNHDYWEIDEEDGTFTTKLTSKILFAMSKLYYYWASIPESSWNIKSIEEFDVGNDDNWDMSVSAPEVWRDLLDETIIQIRGIIWVINDFDKLPEDRKKIHEGSFTFPHEELINILTDIRDTAKNVYETNPLLKVKNLPYKIETPEDKKALNDIRSVGILVKSVLKDWANHYVPEKLKNAFRHGPYRELFTEGFIDTIQEGAFQDIKNGVNPFSDNLVFHVSQKSHFDGQIFQPRVPEYLDPYDPNDNYFEDNTSPRVCFSSSIEGALNGIMVNMERDTPERFDKMYVYVPEKPFKDYKHKTTKQLIQEKKVWDTNVTREVWITEPVRMKLYGTIRVDQISAMKMKSTVKNAKNEKHHRRYFTFKWRWIVPPSVLSKSTKFDYSTDKVCQWLSNDLKRLKYGLIRDGRLMTGNVSDADYNKYWVFHSGQEVDEAGGGNCFDFVEYEAGYLQAYGVTYKKYFMSFTTTNNKPINTHTICVVPYEGKFIYLEGAFKRVTDEWGHMRRRTFNTLNEIFDYVAECSADVENKPINFGVWDYTDEKIDYGTPIKEFMNWIYTHTKMMYDGTAKPFKPVKEAHVMIPSRFVQEAEESVEKITVGDIDLDDDELKEETKEEKTTIETDADETVNTDDIDLGKFGSDVSDEQNEYDPKEIGILMKLMASEADAMNEYMDGAKETNVDVLRRLYADIANEERFHMEQLLFAKCEMTGEKYEPKDPDVKKEYEELLEMGMDETTAMHTAVDKFHIRGSVSDDDDVEDIDIEELTEDVHTAEMAMEFFSQNFDEMMTILETKSVDKKKISGDISAFMEGFYTETINAPGASDMSRGDWTQSPKGVIGILRNALNGLLRLLGQIIRKFKNLIFKIKSKKNKYKTIHDVNGHTWSALFKDGVHFYLFNPKARAGQPLIDDESLLKYTTIIQHLAYLCGNQVKNGNGQKRLDQAKIEALGPMKFDNIAKGISIVEHTNLERIKYVIDQATSDWLDKICFGTNNVTNNRGRVGGFDPMTGEYRSDNIYNKLEDWHKMWEHLLNNMISILDSMKSVKEDQTNMRAYKDALDGMKVCVKGAKAFVNALASDMNELVKINRTAWEEMKQSDARKTASVNNANATSVM